MNNMNCDKTLESVIRSESISPCVVHGTSELLLDVRKAICGKNVFCRDGISQLNKIVQDISDGEGRADDMDFMLEIVASMEELGDCDLSKSTAALVKKAVEEHRDEWDNHIRRKRCPNLVCRHLVTYHILGDKCTGCGECKKVCSDDAIDGEQGLIHVVDAEKCTKCGKCFDTCSKIVEAVVKAGQVKPATPEKPVPVGSWKPADTGSGLKKGLGLRNKQASGK